jgi:hypothetical protein
MGFQSAYQTLTRHGRHVLQVKVSRYNLIVRFSPAVFASGLFILTVVSGYAVDAIQIIVMGICMLMAALIGVIGLYTYSERIDDFIQSKILTTESCIKAALDCYINAGELPAGSLQLPYISVMEIVRPYVLAQGFEKRDSDVCTTILEDGFEGTIDDLLAIARNLRS